MYKRQEENLTSIFFNTSAVLVSEVSMLVLSTFLDFEPAELKPLLTHFSITVMVYYISLPFNMLLTIVVCCTRQSHNLQTEFSFFNIYY